MAIRFLSLAAVAVAACTAATEFDHIVTKVNQMNSTWTAEIPTRFGSMEDVKKVCGTWVKGHPNYVDPELPLGDEEFNIAQDLPTDFDSRKQWGSQCTVITTVRDQSACGSCWAFGSTETFEDRRCIATKIDQEFSAMDTAGCCKGFLCGMSQGCNGGQPSAALKWMSEVGVVTGGDYYANATTGPEGEGCKKYTLKPCAHHVPPSGKYQPCPQQEYSVQCSKECSTGGYPKSYESDKTKGKGAKSYRQVEAMQTAIMNGGPLAVAFTVYDDFPTYKSGVYKRTSNNALGGHAVEMIGWGVDPTGGPYWWIKNSWNNMWGDHGYFKIAKGINECGIEDDVTGIDF
jgi:cathepsin B